MLEYLSVIRHRSVEEATGHDWISYTWTVSKKSLLSHVNIETSSESCRLSALMGVCVDNLMMGTTKSKFWTRIQEYEEYPVNRVIFLANGYFVIRGP
jgi:hypothetical protein